MPAVYPRNLPLAHIQIPTDLDVLCGRGVATNRHVGNESFRAIVKCHKEMYVRSTKTMKMKISRFIVADVRQRGGRFLEKDNETSLWFDVGDKKAVEKTSQALRDGAAPLRKKILEESKKNSKENIKVKSNQDLLTIDPEIAARFNETLSSFQPELVRQRKVSRDMQSAMPTPEYIQSSTQPSRRGESQAKVISTNSSPARPEMTTSGVLKPIPRGPENPVSVSPSPKSRPASVSSAPTRAMHQETHTGNKRHHSPPPYYVHQDLSVNVSPDRSYGPPDTKSNSRAPPPYFPFPSGPPTPSWPYPPHHPYEGYQPPPPPPPHHQRSPYSPYQHESDPSQYRHHPAQWSHPPNDENKRPLEQYKNENAYPPMVTSRDCAPYPTKNAFQPIPTLVPWKPNQQTTSTPFSLIEIDSGIEDPNPIEIDDFSPLPYNSDEEGSNMRESLEGRVESPLIKCESPLKSESTINSENSSSFLQLMQSPFLD